MSFAPSILFSAEASGGITQTNEQWMIRSIGSHPRVTGYNPGFITLITNSYSFFYSGNQSSGDSGRETGSYSDSSRLAMNGQKQWIELEYTSSSETGFQSDYSNGTKGSRPRQQKLMGPYNPFHTKISRLHTRNTLQKCDINVSWYRQFLTH